MNRTYLHQDPTLLNIAFESCLRSCFDLWIVCYSSDFVIDSLSCSSYWNGFESIEQPFAHQTIMPMRCPCSLFIHASEPNGLKIRGQELQKRSHQRERLWPVSSVLAHWLDLAWNSDGEATYCWGHQTRLLRQACWITFPFILITSDRTTYLMSPCYCLPLSDVDQMVPQSFHPERTASSQPILYHLCKLRRKWIKYILYLDVRDLLYSFIHFNPFNAKKYKNYNHQLTESIS